MKNNSTAMLGYKSATQSSVVKDEAHPYVITRDKTHGKLREFMSSTGYENYLADMKYLIGEQPDGHLLDVSTWNVSDVINAKCPIKPDVQASALLTNSSHVHRVVRSYGELDDCFDIALFTVSITPSDRNFLTITLFGFATNRLQQSEGGNNTPAIFVEPKNYLEQTVVFRVHTIDDVHTEDQILVSEGLSDQPPYVEEFLKWLGDLVVDPMFYKSVPANTQEWLN